MKKFCSILVVIFALCMGVIFSACKDNYKFDMKFYLNDKAVSEVNLYIDENDHTDTMPMRVEFSKIKAGKISPVELTIDQPGVALITNEQLSGKTYSFSITALSPIKQAKLTMHHLSSNKTASVTLNIHQRSKTITNLNKTYVVGIPTSGARTATIDAKQLLNFNGTEDVYFTGNLPVGVNVDQQISIDGKNYISSISVSSEVTNGTEVDLTPVFSIPDFYTQELDEKVRIKFVRLINADDINFELNNFNTQHQSPSYQADYLAGKPIVLLNNDEQYRQLKLGISIGQTDNDKRIYSALYAQPEFDNSSCFTFDEIEDGFKISAIAYTDRQTVNLHFYPNADYVGEVLPIDKSLILSSQYRALDLDVYLQDEKQNDLNKLTIYDTYYNQLGGKFNFAPYVVESKSIAGIAQFNYMRLVVPNYCLDAKIADDGLNEVYLNHQYNADGSESFTQLLTEKQGNVKSNKTLLQIFKNGQPIKFWYDSNSSSFISESFVETDDIFIRYTESEQHTHEENPTLKIENFFKPNGENVYFESATPMPSNKTLTFNADYGVTDFDLFAGTVDEKNTFNYLKANDANIKAEHIAIKKSDTQKYALNIANVLGKLVNGDARKVENTQFNLTIAGNENQTNLVKIGVSQADYNFQANLTSTTLDYVSNNTLNSLIYLNFTDADLGNYTLTISQNSGITKSIPVFIYQDASAEDFGDLNFVAGGEYISNNSVDGKVYEDIEADYIVPADENNSLGIYVDNLSKFNLTYNQTKFYNFSLSRSMQYFNNSASKENREAEDFSSYTMFDNDFMAENNIAFGAYFTFTTNKKEKPEAGYFEGGKNYLQLNFELANRYSFANILSEPTANEENKITKTISFYIYKKLNQADFEITSTNNNIYYNNYLAYNFENESKVSLNLTCLKNEDIWYYLNEVSWQQTADLNIADDVANYYTQTENEKVNEFATKLDLQFLKQPNAGAYYVFTATLTQFNKSITIYKRVDVSVPVITNSISIDGINYDLNGNPYLDLQLDAIGEDGYTLGYNQTPTGNITHPGVNLFVLTYSEVSRNYTISANSGNITFNGNKILVSGSLGNNLKLLVVASDVIKNDLNGSYTTITEFTQKFINPNELDYKTLTNNPYLGAYKIIDLYITDGSQASPIIIDSAQDFANLESYANINDKWFVITRDINLQSLTAPISKFGGHIITLQDEIVNLDVSLNNNVPNLITQIVSQGTIKNVAFNVNYNYNYNNAQGTINLGVIGNNAGELNYVYVTFGGNANFEQTGNVYFGGLVGYNTGKINYRTQQATSAEIIKSNKSAVTNLTTFNLLGNAEVYFGGLVGYNTGEIGGEEFNSNSDGSEKRVEFASNVSSGATAQIDINSNLTNQSSAVGGLVGYNNAGKINKVLVRGNIVGTNNLGGIIGKNSTTSKNAQIGYQQETINNITLGGQDAFEISDCISQVIISGNNNIGGVVGQDTNGRYYNCAYQIYQLNSVLTGDDSVGGIAGYSLNGWFNYCYVFSYKWDYSALSTMVESEVNSADIVGKNYVAGLVGKAASSWSDTSSTSTQSLVVLQSSVNAYLKATEAKNNSLSGILNVSEENSSQIQLSAIYNAYFMGKLDGNYLTGTNNLILSNKMTGSHRAAYGNVYSVIYEGDKNVEASYNTPFDPKTTSSEIGVWGKDEQLNGGYIYILKDGKPLFELSPTNINATLIENTNVRGAYKINDNTLYLSYYNFNLGLSADNQTILNALQRYNTYPILSNGQDIVGLMNFDWQPEEIKTLRLLTQSQNSILQIVDGNIVVTNIGTTSIEFSSLLNPSKKAVVNVVVGYPFGTQFSLRESLTSLANLSSTSTFNVGVNKTREIVSTFAGAVSLDNGNLTSYNYTVSNQIKYKVTAEFDDEDRQEEFAEFITNSVTIGGQGFVLDEDKYSLVANNLTISVFKRFEGEIRFTVLPVLEVNSFGTTLATITDENMAVDFNFFTLAGATKVETQSNNLVVYPNTALEDSNSFKVDITTDFEYSEEDLDFTSPDSKLQIQIYIDGDLVGLSSTNILDIIDFATLDGSKKITYNSATQKQTLSFNIRFNTLANLASDSTSHKIRFQFIVNSGSEYMVQNSAVFNLLPQQIRNINIRNYQYNPNSEDKIVESSYLYPSTSSSESYGLIIIDMYPLNGYFDYLEIRDTTNTSSRVNFVQVDSEFRRVGMDTPTADGGKRLVKLSDYDGKVYALTQIAFNAEEITHNIEVRAYINTASGPSLLLSATKQFEVRLQPEVVVEYLTPSRALFDRAINNEANRKNQLAYGVDAEFRLVTNNLSGLQPSLSFVDSDLNISEYFSLQAIGNNYYRLYSLKQTNDLINKTVHVGFTGVRVLNTGEEISTTTGFDLTITWFMVYGVSLTNSRTIGQDRQLIGNLDKPIDFEFYFASGDVSYYLNNGASYHYSDSVADAGEQKIVNILKVLNGQNVDGSSVDISDLLHWYAQNDNLVSEDDLSTYGVNLNRGTTPPQLTVESNDIQYLQLQFKLIEQNNYKEVAVLGEDETGFDYTYQLNFVRQAPVFDAELVDSESKFYTMVGAGTRYILGKDLEFNSDNPYVPFSLDVAEFDGNGHTIKISAFADFEGRDISAGLFTEISATTVVKNLQVEYVLGDIRGGIRQFVAENPYTLGGENSLYNTINFGGIAVQNNGVITNCKVTGTLVLSQTNIERPQSGVSPINIGGLVFENSSSAYITNCVSELKISSMANIGGLAHTNAGKISSSYFDASQNKGLIYAFFTYAQIDPNTGSSYDLVANSAGFVYQNSGAIDMCYVVSGSTLSSQNNSTLGNLASKNDFAGFAYTNSGTISNSYTNIEKIDLNLASFAAFVFRSSNSITNCYTYINSGNQLISSQYSFAPDNALTGEVNNCYTVVTNDAQTNNTNIIKKIQLNSLTTNAQIESQFKGFSFGDNASAVWQLNDTESPKLPKLSATLETMAFDDKFDTNPNTNATYDIDGTTKKVTRFYGWRDVVVFDEAVIIDGSERTHLILTKTDGTKQNPYTIYDVETFNAYFANDSFLNSYYRLVKDIDFNLQKPYTSDKKFAGNIQGNGLTISNFRLHTEEDLTSIGLFSELDGESGDYQNNAIRNLKIVDADISAIKTEAVGALAGIVTNYRLYNITVDSRYIILGKNTVGGLAGLIRGQFDIQTIRSNVSGHSEYEYTNGNYIIYQSRLNNTSSNLSNVHYAGSVAGILDAYRDISTNISERSISGGNRVNDIVVEGQILQISGTVGGAFGLVKEYTNLSDVSVNLVATEEESKLNKLSGYQYSGGVVGENRGVITNATFSTTVTSVFDSSRVVSAGLVALNMGYIGNSKANFNAIRSDADSNYSNTSVLAGLVGRDVNGYLQNCTFDGQILSYRSNATEITAGAIGTRYTAEKMVGGAISQLSTESANVLADFTYTDLDDTSHIYNVQVSQNAINFWLNNLNNIYVVRESGASVVFEGGRVLAAGVGLQTQDDNDFNYAFDANGNFVINGTADNKAVIGMFTQPTMFDGKVYDESATPYANVFAYNVPIENQVYLLYAIGASVNEFDIWTRTNYAGEMMLLKNDIADVSKLFVNKNMEQNEDLGGALRIKTLNTTQSISELTVSYTIYASDLNDSGNTFVVYSNDKISSADYFYISKENVDNEAEAQQAQDKEGKSYYSISFDKGDVVKAIINESITLEFNFISLDKNA